MRLYSAAVYRGAGVAGVGLRKIGSRAGKAAESGCLAA